MADGVTALSKLGVSVNVLVPTPWAPKSVLLNKRWALFASTPCSWLVDSHIAHRVRYLAVPKVQMPMIDIATLSLPLNRILRKPGFKSNIIHAHTLFPDGVAVALSLPKRIPLIVSIHGADVRPGTGLEWDIRMKIGRWTLRAVQKVIANSNRTKTRICEFFGVDSGKVIVLPPGLAGSRLDMFSFEGLPATEKAPVIVAVGNLVRLKGHADLLRALASAKLRNIEWTLAIIGDGPERKQLEQMVFSLGIAPRVSFLGRVPPNEVPKHLCGAQVFALPSFDEAWGVAWAEAQYLGLPAIGCRGQGTEEIIQDNETGYLVNSGDLDELSDRLFRLLVNPNLRAQMGNIARKRAKMLDVDRIAPQLLNVYNDIIESPSRNGKGHSQ